MLCLNQTTTNYKALPCKYEFLSLATDRGGRTVLDIALADALVYH